ncbi:MAG TPA: CBS domain-containing protein, partial [Thermoanaerobaculia bacterium]|nr:CBS domain-containing protein [Thermoanaerobaculia bacterium]
ENWTVRELAQYFTDRSISGAPVLDAAGRLTGVVSLSDIVDQVTRDRESDVPRGRGWEDRCNPEDLKGLAIEDPGRLVSEIMTPTFFTIPDTTSLPKIARTMVAGRIHRLLVTRERHVVGIVTTLDLLRELAGMGVRRPGRRAPAARRPAARAAAAKKRSR